MSNRELIIQNTHNVECQFFKFLKTLNYLKFSEYFQTKFPFIWIAYFRSRHELLKGIWSKKLWKNATWRNAIDQKDCRITDLIICLKTGHMVKRGTNHYYSLQQYEGFLDKWSNWIVYAIINILYFNNLDNLLIIQNWSNFKMSNWLVYAVIQHFVFQSILIYGHILSTCQITKCWKNPRPRRVKGWKYGLSGC